VESERRVVTGKHSLEFSKGILGSTDVHPRSCPDLPKPNENVALLNAEMLISRPPNVRMLTREAERSEVSSGSTLS
jgi:hypothetical protein